MLWRHYERSTIIVWRVLGFGRVNVPSVLGRDKDYVPGVLTLANEEPLVVVEACINVMWEIVG